MLFYLHARSMRIAVAVMLPGDLLQQPVTPVQNAAKMVTKVRMNRAIIERPMSVKSIKISFSR